MTKNFNYYYLRLLCFGMFLFSICMPGQAKAQKEATAYLLNPVVYINLMLPSGDTLLLVDGTGALYGNQFSANVDADDAGKLSNMNENICLFRNGQKLAIEARPIPRQADTLFIRMWGMVMPKYDLQVMIKGIPLMLPVQAWLVDNYLHTQTPINLFGKNTYNFTLTADTGSYLNRFIIVFDKSYRQGNNLVNTGKASQLNTGQISVYPNPVTGNRLSLHFMGMLKDNYTIKLTGLSGETLAGINIMHPGGNSEYYLPLNSVYTKGVYAVTIFGINTRKIIHLPVIINQ